MIVLDSSAQPPGRVYLTAEAPPDDRLCVSSELLHHANGDPVESPGDDKIPLVMLGPSESISLECKVAKKNGRAHARHCPAAVVRFKPQGDKTVVLEIEPPGRRPARHLRPGVCGAGRAWRARRSSWGSARVRRRPSPCARRGCVAIARRRRCGPRQPPRAPPTEGTEERRGRERAIREKISAWLRVPCRPRATDAVSVHVDIPLCLSHNVEHAIARLGSNGRSDKSGARAPHKTLGARTLTDAAAPVYARLPTTVLVSRSSWPRR